MDIYDYLKMDHRKVADLFKQFEKSNLLMRKKEIVALIAEELVIHAKSEQETFYKVLEKHAESKEDADHGFKEHKEIVDQIHLVIKSDASPAVWEKKVLKLKDLVEHHVNEEEGAIFRKAKKVLSEEEAYALKELMHARKTALMPI